LHTTKKVKNQDAEQKKVFLSFEPLQDEDKAKLKAPYNRNGRA
jgi:Cu/Ag efflux protein CusF